MLSFQIVHILVQSTFDLEQSNCIDGSRDSRRVFVSADKARGPRKESLYCTQHYRIVTDTYTP